MEVREKVDWERRAKIGEVERLLFRWLLLARVEDVEVRSGEECDCARKRAVEL